MENIILDIDRTLIFGYETKYGPIIVERPFLKDFFNFIFKRFTHVSIWTSATTNWYRACHDQVFKKYLHSDRKFDVVITRDNNIIRSEDNTKNLHKLFKIHDKYNVNNTFIIDDNPYTYRFNVINAIPIKEFKNTHEDKYDAELIRIMDMFDLNIHTYDV